MGGNRVRNVASPLNTIRAIYESKMDSMITEVVSGGTSGTDR